MSAKVIILVLITLIVAYYLLIWLPKYLADWYTARKYAADPTRLDGPTDPDSLLEKAESVAAQKEAVVEEIFKTEKKITRAKRTINK